MSDEPVWIDRSPQTWNYEVDGAWWEWSEQVTALPDAFLDVLEPIAELVDNARCPGCGEAFGFTLHGDDDSRVEWTTVILAQDADGAVSARCEFCVADAELVGES